MTDYNKLANSIKSAYAATQGSEAGDYHAYSLVLTALVQNNIVDIIAALRLAADHDTAPFKPGDTVELVNVHQYGKVTCTFADAAGVWYAVVSVDKDTTLTTPLDNLLPIGKGQ